MAGLCGADAVNIWRGVLAEVELAGVSQVWLAVYSGVYWMLVCVSPEDGIVSAYDALHPESRFKELPPHYVALQSAISQNGNQWFHEYLPCCVPPEMSPALSGSWMLKTLDCLLGNKEVNMDDVSW